MNDGSELYDIIDELVAEHGRSWVKISEIIGEHPEKLRSIYRRKVQADTTTDPDKDLQAIEFRDKKTQELPPWRDLVDHAINGESINEDLEFRQRTAEIRINTDKPVIVVYTGDWHLGDGATDHKRWLKDIDMIINTPNAYLVDLGDDYQNMRSFKSLSAVLNQVLTPPQQAAMMKSLVLELTSQNKIIAKIGGNHDEEFDLRLFGEAVQAYLYEKMNAPIFPNRGLVHLSVGKQTYTNLLFHKSRFRSILRPAHGAYREWQLGYPAEVVVGAHDHTPAFEVFWAHQVGYARERDQSNGEVFLIKIGTYQDSEFGYRYFHGGGFPLNPAVVYYPNKHKKVAFLNVEDAIKFLGE